MDLTLHIGMGKTGTSSIQYFLRAHDELLAQGGTLFPRTPGGLRHPRFTLFVTPDHQFRGNRIARQQSHVASWGRFVRESPASFRSHFLRALLEEVRQSGAGHVLLSDEALFASSEGRLRNVGAFAREHARSTRLVCYLRRQDEHLVSRYQQAVKWGEVRKLAQRTAEMDHEDIYDYAGRLHAWASLVEPSELVVRRFDPPDFVGGSLVEDFCVAAGVDLPAEAFRDEVPRRNESLDAESVEFLRVLNLLRVHRRGARGTINNRRVVRRLADASTGPVLSLSEPVLDRFMARWEEGNRLVAARYLGETGDLFTRPRTSRPTTSHQYLDPARLDHFLEVAELPRRLRAPLRRLTEREAAG